MEIKITHMINDNMWELAGSVATHGPDAAKYTWENSQEYAKKHPLLKTDAERNKCVEYFMTFGASWTEEELREDIESFLTQFIALEIRDLEHLDESEWEDESKNGNVSGRIYKSGNDYYIYIGE